MKNCNKCGAMIPDEAMFCTSCGTKIENDLEGTTVLDDNLSSRDAGVFEETNFSDTSVLNEQDWDDTSILVDPTANIPEFRDINSAFVNPNSQQNPTQQFNNISNQKNPSPNKMTYLDFFDKFASKKVKNNAKTVGIICIITAVISLGILGATTNPLSVIDIIFYGVFAGLILKKKNWVFTLPVCIYGGVFTIIGLVMSGTPSGIFAFVMSIIATISLKKVDEAYKQYLVTNQLPENEI